MHFGQFFNCTAVLVTLVIAFGKIHFATRCIEDGFQTLVELFYKNFAL